MAKAATKTAKSNGKRIFNSKQMKITQVKDGGDQEHPKAYLHFEAKLSAKEEAALGIDGIETSGVDTNKKIPLDVEDVKVLPYGEGFAMKIVMGDPDPEQEKIFPSGTVLPEVECEKIVSASLSEHTLTQSILVPLTSWEKYGVLRDYAGQTVKVTIFQGAVANKGEQAVINE